AGSEATFYVLEHDRPADLPLDKPLSDFRGGLASFSTVLPHPISAGGRRDLAPLLAEIEQELQRRQSADDRQGPAIYLFISDLGRFRDMDTDDDRCLSVSADKPTSPSQLLTTILRDGPAVGIFTLAWCDSLTAV